MCTSTHQHNSVQQVADHCLLNEYTREISRATECGQHGGGTEPSGLTSKPTVGNRFDIRWRSSKVRTTVPMGQSGHTNKVCGWWGKEENEACEARVDNAIKGLEKAMKPRQGQ